MNSAVNCVDWKMVQPTLTAEVKVIEVALLTGRRLCLGMCAHLVFGDTVNCVKGVASLERAVLISTARSQAPDTSRLPFYRLDFMRALREFTVFVIVAL